MKKIWFAVVLVLSSSVIAEDDYFSKIQIKRTQVSGSVYMLQGAGGNIGVSAGDDGLLIVDDQFAQLADKIQKSLQDIVKKPVKYIVNTHYHGDHTGANEFFVQKHDSTIFAHHNIRKRLKNQHGEGSDFLPVVTYEDGIKFHFNNDTIHVKHLPQGHTDGDSYLWFEKSNVIHTGDLFFHNRFPYVDLDGGGTVDGYTKAVRAIIQSMPEDATIIPGHGDVTNIQDYRTFLAMLEETVPQVRKMKADGMTVEQAIAKGLGEKWVSWSWEFISEKRWIETIYNDQGR